MLQVSVIGHLGADAKVKSANGKQFVSFNVAHTDVWQDEKQVKHEETTWVSCALNGNGGNVLPYLKRGQQVFCQGRASLRVYSSKKARAMVAGVNLSVDRIELVGGRADDVPRELIAEGGAILRTNKIFFVTLEDAAAAGLEMKGSDVLCAANGAQFAVNEQGFIFPCKPEDEPADENA